MRNRILPAKTGLLTGFLALAVALGGCGGAAGSKVVDDYLGKLEKAIAQWEAKIKAQSFTLYDFGELNKASVELIGEGKLLQYRADWSAGQRQKFADLSARFSKMLMELCANPKALK